MEDFIGISTFFSSCTIWYRENPGLKGVFIMEIVDLGPQGPIS